MAMDVPNKIGQNSIILTISFSQFVIPFMFSGVGITLPTVGMDLHASAVQLGLVETIYLGAAAAFLLPLGKLADVTDKNAIFKTGLILYSIITFLLGSTFNMNLFIGLRFFQGLAGGMLMATNMAILSELVPRQNLGKAIGTAVGAVYLGVTTGPLLAGAITKSLGWRYVYHLGGMLTTIVMLISMFTIKRNKKFQFVKIDLAGSLMIITGISLLIVGSASLSKSVWSYLIFLPGIIFILLFLRRQRRVADPLINLEMLSSNRKLKVAIIAQLINYAGTFGITFLFSLYLQIVRGMNPQQAGMVLIISPVIMFVCAPLFGRLSDRISPSRIAMVGMVFCWVATMMASQVDATTSMTAIYIQFATMGLGFAMFSSPNMNIIMSSVEKRYLSMASALVAELRSLGMVTSLIIVSTFLAIYVGHHQLNGGNAAKYLPAMHFSIMTFVVLMGIGVVISLIGLKKK